MTRARQKELFEKPRKARRVLMHAIDTGLNHCEGPSLIGHFKCTRCGHDGGWLVCETMSEIWRGVPCPNCNKERR